MNVLMAEDNAANAALIVEFAKILGWSIDVVPDGEQCVSTITESPDKYDVVLMDIMMPVMDGIQASFLIRANTDPIVSSKPIVVLTADVADTTRANAIKAGVNGYLTKPIALSDLKSSVDACFNEGDAR